MRSEGNGYREVARVVMHLPEGFTKVELERFRGLGHVGGEVAWDIPTSTIPYHLRGIGSRFIVTGSFARPAPDATADEIRALARLPIRVVELDE